MAHRKKIQNIGLDQEIFRRTATKTKKVNLGRKSLRGGTRF